MTFGGDGTYTEARQDVGVVASGTYAVEGATLTFNDWTGLIGCGLPQQETTSATYAWQIVDETLTLTPITEECTDRPRSRRRRR